VFAVSL